MFVLWGRAFGSALFFWLGGVKKPGRSLDTPARRMKKLTQLTYWNLLPLSKWTNSYFSMILTSLRWYCFEVA
jgi:hypothetical protein